LIAATTSFSGNAPKKAASIVFANQLLKTWIQREWNIMNGASSSGKGWL